MRYRSRTSATTAKDKMLREIILKAQKQQMDATEQQKLQQELEKILFQSAQQYQSPIQQATNPHWTQTATQYQQQQNNQEFQRQYDRLREQYREPPPPPDAESLFESDWRRSMGANWRKQTEGIAGKEVAKVWLDEGKGMICSRFAYKAEVIEEFRAKIPKGKKSWNSSEHIWEFSVEVIDLVIEILTRHFSEVLDLTQTSAPTISNPISADPLLSLLDKEDVDRIYKMLVKKYHPDVASGDGDKMARINQLFRSVK